VRILDDETGHVLNRISAYLERGEMEQLATHLSLVDEEDLDNLWHMHLDSPPDGKTMLLGVYDLERDAGERLNQLFREDRWDFGPVQSD
jgi:hypothetical protein